MAERARSGWEGVNARPTDFDVYGDMVRLALNGANLGVDIEPARDAFTTVSASVVLGAPAYRKLPGEGKAVLREALTSPSASTAGEVERYLALLAEVQGDGRP